MAAIQRSEVGVNLFALFQPGAFAPGISGDILPVSPRQAPASVLVPATGYYVNARLVYNTSGADIPTNQIVRFKDGSDIEVLECATAELSAEKIAGVAPQAIPNGYYGYVVSGGKFATLNDSGAPIAAGDRIKTTASGGIATNDETTSARVAGRFGIALAAIADGATGLVQIDLPG